MGEMHVSVFGGSQIQAGHPVYEDAYRLGTLLAQAGYAVLTGGYGGTMEAVSRGAAEAGGHVIGVTCTEIEAWRAVPPNPWVKEERRFPTIRQRIFHLIEACNAAIALPGGPGTLAEITILWIHLFTSALPPKPLILMGKGWQRVFDLWFQEMGEFTPMNERAWLTFVSDPAAALDALQQQRPR